jgi:hypothetical protein
VKLGSMYSWFFWLMLSNLFLFGWLHWDLASQY